MSESVACVVPPNRIAHLRLLERTKERRAALVMKLGGRCIHCGATENLEFDHHSGRNWTIRDKSRWTRMSIYEREAARGRLRLLCRSCNASYRAKKSKDDAMSTTKTPQRIRIEAGFFRLEDAALATKTDKEIAISRDTIARYESGKLHVLQASTFKYWRRLAKVFRVSFEVYRDAVLNQRQRVLKK